MPALFCYFLFRCPVGHRSLHFFGEPRNWTIASALDSKMPRRLLFSLKWENWSLFPNTCVRVGSLSPAFSFFSIRFISIIITLIWQRNFARISPGGGVFSGLIMVSQWFLPHSGLLWVQGLLRTPVWRAAAGSVATNIFMRFFRHTLCNKLLTLIAWNCSQSLSP